MKFSILIPTRERLELLRHAVESVRLQDYSDWEVIVSDNASSQDVAGYVASLADKRIRYARTERLIPVTDNWNLALERSSGDYIIMLGDDDALLPGCLTKARALVERWGSPDAIYTQALQFAYPGVIPDHPEGFIQTGYNEFFRSGAAEPFLLAADAALGLVRHAMQFRIRYGFNMQHFIISARLVERLRPKGPFFQSPYPDYYAANAILLAARSIVANPRPLVLIGISPKSFGFYYHNRREADGVEFLQNALSPGIGGGLRAKLVPGTNMNDSWLCAMEALALNFSERRNLQVNLRRYRLLQYQSLLQQRSWRALGTIVRYSKWWEWPLYAPVVAAYAIAFILPARLRVPLQEGLRASLSAYPRFDLHRRIVPYRDILEAVRSISA